MNHEVDYADYLGMEFWTPKLSAKLLAGIDPAILEDKIIKDSLKKYWSLEFGV